MEPPLSVATPEALARAMDGAPLEALPGGFMMALPTLVAPLFPAQDPRNRWDFTRAAFVYGPRALARPPRPGLFLLVALHYENDADRDLAARIARLTARLLRLFGERLGRDTLFPRGNEVADVWLTRRRPVGAGGVHLGGETWNNQVYFYSVEAQRTGLEWTRTVAHEWGHLTLPAARGYEEPEGDASGFLGERLYMNWLFEDQKRPDAPKVADGVTLPDLETYYRRQTAPLLARFAQGGPQSRQMDDRGAGGMDYYIAAALAFEQAVGSKLLGESLFTINNDGPRDLLDAMRRAVANAETVTIHLPAWVPLPKARYLLTGDAPGQVALADRPPLAVRPDTPTRLDMKLPGWKRIRATSGGIRTLTLKRI